MTRRTPARGHRGKFARDPNTAEQDAAACRLRADGYTYRAIATELGTTVSCAHESVQRALRAIVEEPAKELLTLEAERIDALYAEAMAVMRRDHLTVSHGKVIYLEDSETGEKHPLLDDGPKLAAIREARQLRESFWKLKGIAAAAKLDLNAKVEITPEDIALRQLIADAEAKNAEEEARLRGEDGAES